MWEVIPHNCRIISFFVGQIIVHKLLALPGGEEEYPVAVEYWHINDLSDYISNVESLVGGDSILQEPLHHQHMHAYGRSTVHFCLYECKSFKNNLCSLKKSVKSEGGQTIQYLKQIFPTPEFGHGPCAPNITHSSPVQSRQLYLADESPNESSQLTLAGEVIIPPPAVVTDIPTLESTSNEPPKKKKHMPRRTSPLPLLGKRNLAMPLPKLKMTCVSLTSKHSAFMNNTQASTKHIGGTAGDYGDAMIIAAIAKSKTWCHRSCLC